HADGGEVTSRETESWLVSQNFRERVVQLGVREAIACLLKLFWRGALARQKQPVDHFSQSEPQRECRRRQNRQSVQRLRQCPRDSSFAHGFRRHRVQRSALCFVFYREENHLHGFFQRQPGHPLPPRAEPSADAQPKRPQHLCKRAALLGQDNAKPQPGHAHAEGFAFCCLRFPVPCQGCKKIASRRALFRQDFFSAIAVVAPRGG